MKHIVYEYAPSRKGQQPGQTEKEKPIGKIFGNTKGLTPSDRRDLERLYRRRIPPDRLITPELARTLAEISCRTRRQTGLIVDRRGMVRHVVVGDHHGILIPDISAHRRGPGRLKGLRCIHTHLGTDEGLNAEDLTDLALLRMDAMVAIEVADSLPGKIHTAHLLPPNPENRHWDTVTYRHASAVNVPFGQFIQELEGEVQRAHGGQSLNGAEERAMLVHASPVARDEAEQSMEELAQLALSANVEVLERILQRTPRYNAAHLLGQGKLREILMKGLYLGATLVIFDQDLSPVQVNNIARMVDLKVIDRTQLILDIFARRARSKEGKIQVELAQLKYLLPRLVGRGTAMSRLMGGIGGRGPGETKLEVDRRRVKQRIASLERELRGLAQGRRERRKQRNRHGIPLISIIGYTNAGKSTLLNRLTGSRVVAEDRLFATLDPTTRRFRFPDGREALLADTVGFIRHMPRDLRVAFKATLEELEDAEVFLQVLDLTSPNRQEEMAAVEKILEEMDLSGTPRILVLNKADLSVLDGGPAAGAQGIRISASTGAGIDRLIETLASALPPFRCPGSGTPGSTPFRGRTRSADPPAPARPSMS